MNLRDAILSANDLPKKPITAWGINFFIRALSAADAELYMADIQPARHKDEDDESYAARRALAQRNFRARLIVFCAVDENGQRVFKDEDADALGQKSGIEVGKVFQAITELNGNLEEATKNSDAGPTGDSTSASA